MVGAILDVVTLVVYGAAIVKVVSALRGRQLTTRDRHNLRLAFVAGLVVFLKFWAVKDVTLIIGQSALLLVVGLYGFAAFATPQQRPQESAVIPASNRPRPRRTAGKKLWLRLGAALALIALAIWAVKLISAPATGTISTSDVPQTAPSTKLLTLTGQHFSFSYPDELHPIADDPATPPFLENYNLVKSQIPNWLVAVQIESFPSGRLQDDGSYHFRSIHPERFSEDLTTINGVPVSIMTDKTAGGGFGKVAFFMSKGLLASVALSGGRMSDTPSMQMAFTSILQSWHWK